MQTIITYFICDKLFKNGPRIVYFCGIEHLKKFEAIWSVKTDDITPNFLKAVFQKFYLVHY